MGTRRAPRFLCDDTAGVVLGEAGPCFDATELIGNFMCLTHRQLYVLAIGMLAFAPAPLRSQPIGDADAGFEERFLMDERSAPTFMRPEVIELLASLPP